MDWSVWSPSTPTSEARAERVPLLKKQKQRLVVRVRPTKREELPQRQPSLMASPQRLRRWATVSLIALGALAFTGSLGSPTVQVLPAEDIFEASNEAGAVAVASDDEAREATTTDDSVSEDASKTQKHHHRHGHRRGASSTVRSRSIFTCCLCVAASIVILAPRLACGPDDERGVAAGPGRAEEYVANEVVAAVRLLAPFVVVGVPYDLANRAVVRGAFPYPLCVTALELAACLCVAACLSTRDVLSRRLLVEVPLGCCFFVATAGAREANRTSRCGPALAASFSNAANGVIVLCLVVFVGVLFGQQSKTFFCFFKAAAPSSSSSADEERQTTRPSRREVRLQLDDDDDDESTASSEVSAVLTVRQRRRRQAATLLRHQESYADDAAPSDAEEPEEEDCCLAMKVPGIPNCSAAVALMVALGGAAIMAIGERSAGPAGPACVGVLGAAQVCGALYVVGFQEHFARHPDVPRGFLASSGTAFALAAAAAVARELSSVATSSSSAPVVLPSGAAWLVLLDAAAFALLAYVSLLVLARFSALVLVLFAALRAVASTFAAAAVFGDLVTSLEYKGAMILVLGQVIYALEVSKALLEDPPPLAPIDASNDDVPGIGPSPFLQPDDGDKDDDLLSRARLRRSGFSTTSESPSTEEVRPPFPPPSSSSPVVGQEPSQ